MKLYWISLLLFILLVSCNPSPPGPSASELAQMTRTEKWASLEEGMTEKTVFRILGKPSDQEVWSGNTTYIFECMMCKTTFDDGGRLWSWNVPPEEVKDVFHEIEKVMDQVVEKNTSSSGWAQLKKGMSEAEVFQLLGKPTQKREWSGNTKYTFDCFTCTATFDEDGLWAWHSPDEHLPDGFIDNFKELENVANEIFGETTSAEGWSKLKKGMSEAEVFQLLGKPTKKREWSGNTSYTFGCFTCTATFDEDGLWAWHSPNTSPLEEFKDFEEEMTGEQPTTSEKWGLLEKGMTVYQVLSILGKPTNTEVSPGVIVYTFDCSDCKATFDKDGILFSWYMPEEKESEVKINGGTFD